jgi:hypothetical protein
MTDYDPAYPCEHEYLVIDSNGLKPRRYMEKCGAPTVFVMIAAPGTGQGRSCARGHYVGTCRELTIEDVI